MTNSNFCFIVVVLFFNLSVGATQRRSQHSGISKAGHGRCNGPSRIFVADRRSSLHAQRRRIRHENRPMHANRVCGHERDVSDLIRHFSFPFFLMPAGIFSTSIHKSEKVHGHPHKTYVTTTLTRPVSGRTFALNQMVNEFCNVIHSRRTKTI